MGRLEQPSEDGDHAVGIDGHDDFASDAVVTPSRAASHVASVTAWPYQSLLK